MGIRDALTSKARHRLEAQVGPNEQVLLSGTVGPMGMVLTDRRLMLAPPAQGVYQDVNLPLSAIHNVAWKKGILGSPGLLSIHTSSQVHEYKVPNKQGEPAVTAIRQAIAAR